MEKLALLGGKAVLETPLPETNTIDNNEKEAVMRVMDSGRLSGFLAQAGDEFLGGKEVRKVEDAFCRKFGCKHAVTFNSATTALEAAICALGIGPGDEVILPPYTMHASATVILMNNAIPVFADIEMDTFCIDPKSIRAKITQNTKAILVVDLFGGPARYDEILQIAAEHNLKVIEDNAQGPGALYKGRHVGTIGDVGVFSLNRHKTIQSGEGGVLVTDNDKIAYRAQLRRNHGEAVLNDLNDYNEPMCGSNYRLSEIHATIAFEQLKKLDFLNERRIELADYLTKNLSSFKGLETPYVIPETKHVYYFYPMTYDAETVGISRRTFVRAMAAEGFTLSAGYQKPIYLIPLFQNKKMFPRTNCPFDCKHYSGEVDYSKGLCPNTELLWSEKFLSTNICRYPLEKKHMDLFIAAVKKVFDNREQLKEFDSEKDCVQCK